MKYKWLNQNNNQKIILFFNGWGMDECVVKHLDPEDYDILMFYDYNSLETDFDFDLLKTYTEIALIAWSMGTMIATLFPQINSKNRTAINGTLKSIDTEYGIHPRIYDLTIKGFDEKGREKFIDSMFEEKQEILCL
jgi:biotin synthesis protein BioG